MRQQSIEVYGQDEWRFRPNLTLYFGLRYSYFGAPWDRNGRLTNFVPALFNAAAAPQVTGAGNRVAGTGSLLQRHDRQLAERADGAERLHAGRLAVGQSTWSRRPRSDFPPRVGLAWDPFGKGKTSIRTGYGIFYDQVLSGTYLQNIGTNPPYQETFTISAANLAVGATPPSLDRPVPPGVSVGPAASVAALSVRALQPDWKDPYMQQWSFEVQQQLGAEHGR